MSSRVSTITDWRIRDEDLPDISPGRECVREITPQKFVVLRKILVPGLSLIRLRIGAVDEVPFELEGADGRLRTYRPALPNDARLVTRLIAAGARAEARDAIRVVPGMSVWLILRNETDAPAKPLASLLVEEEIR
jgi:hypothetical protein